jgi:hypothetical protein
MNTNAIKNKVGNAAIKTVTGVFGAAHFVAQSAADSICHAEARIICASNKGMYDKDTIVEYRRAETKHHQQGVMSYINKTKANAEEFKQQIVYGLGPIVNESNTETV